MILHPSHSLHIRDPAMSILTSHPPPASAFGPIAALVIYIAITLFFTVKVVTDIISRARRLGSSFTSASISTQQACSIALFILSVLACTSAYVTCRALTRHAELSYNAWATLHGVAKSKSFWVEVGSCFMRRLTNDEMWSDGGVYLGLWVGDSNVRNEFWVCILRGHQRFWWSLIWVLVGFVFVWDATFRGRKHSITSLPYIAALSQLVSVSFAQTLFLMHILLSSFPRHSSSSDDTDSKSSLSLTPSSTEKTHSSRRLPTRSHLLAPMLLTAYTLISIYLLFHSHSPNLRFYTTTQRFLTLSIPYFIRNRPSFYIDVRAYTTPKVRLALLATLLCALAIPFKGDPMTLPALRKETRTRPAFGAVGWDLGLTVFCYILWDVWELTGYA
ncbi:hypothetical protein EJ05DRAFT_29095 [Pseudovirgaria hyperparasitica]|uniref:Uncharacterized protein n=1 Tax=Pseudovirgaria hyperparasitica TaxID=470096 RepID=A0A6A6WLV2_9PEZI|nr:uncharacterized protein EJ05DRAFT_29095 [Pseudovirgaria hyperparasitica]KAF2763190.1 hypothetical protein EJ05DRAFT_29095 [Pseudovirgaria hyperparasitica]